MCFLYKGVPCRLSWRRVWVGSATLLFAAVRAWAVAWGGVGAMQQEAHPRASLKSKPVNRAQNKGGAWRGDGEVGAG